MKIGILGGSFDPIHEGHMAMAHESYKQLNLDEVWILPTAKTPLKSRELTDNEHRLNMIRLAIEEYSYIHLCTLEMEREGTSYTVDTARELKSRFPMHSFYWIIGNDQLSQFHLWKDADEIVKLVQVVSFDRDGELSETPYDIQRLKMPMMPVSSSEIRIGNKLNYMNPKVLEYIYGHRLYIENFVRTRVTEKRFQHSVSVANLCEELAFDNDLDTQKAYLIGLFHDIAKSMTKEEMEPWMDVICPENKKYAVAVWHGFVGSEIVDRIFYLHDPIIKNAIYHHVLGTSEDPYAMLIFCADKLDPLRNYDTSFGINICKENLRNGFEYEKAENKKYLEGK